MSGWSPCKIYYCHLRFTLSIRPLLWCPCSVTALYGGSASYVWAHALFCCELGQRWALPYASVRRSALPGPAPWGFPVASPWKRGDAVWRCSVTRRTRSRLSPPLSDQPVYKYHRRLTFLSRQTAVIPAFYRYTLQKGTEYHHSSLRSWWFLGWLVFFFRGALWGW